MKFKPIFGNLKKEWRKRDSCKIIRTRSLFSNILNCSFILSHGLILQEYVGNELKFSETVTEQIRAKIGGNGNSRTSSRLSILMNSSILQIVETRTRLELEVTMERWGASSWRKASADWESRFWAFPPAASKWLRDSVAADCRDFEDGPPIIFGIKKKRFAKITSSWCLCAWRRFCFSVWFA